MSRASKKRAVAKKLAVVPAPQRNAAADMYANPWANTGFGSSSQANGGIYIPYRISLDYQQLLNMYRGSWIVRAVVDTIPEDMLKDFPELITEATPEDITEFNKVLQSTRTLQKLVEGMKWGRLFGGAIAIIILKGDNDLSKPLIIEDVEPDTYRGMIVVDRWSGVSPGNVLISDLDNPAEYGLPEFYDVTTEVNQNFRVHHSRVLRFTGRDLPLFERQIQTYWGMSEVECMLEDLKRRDFAAAGIADLISRANVMVVQNDMLAQLLSGVGLTQQQLNDYILRVQAVSQAISTNGLLALGKDEQMFSNSYSFSGLSDIYQMLMLDVTGASGIPFSKFYGRTPTGLGQSGEGDQQNYDNLIDQKRTRELRPLLDKLIPTICMSVWGEVPEDLDYQFSPIRSISPKEKADIATAMTEPVLAAYNAGAFGLKTLLRELKGTSGLTGIFSNITDEMIAKATDEPLELGDVLGLGGEEDGQENGAGSQSA